MQDFFHQHCFSSYLSNAPSFPFANKSPCSTFGWLVSCVVEPHTLNHSCADPFRMRTSQPHDRRPSAHHRPPLQTLWPSALAGKPVPTSSYKSPGGPQVSCRRNGIGCHCCWRENAILPLLLDFVESQSQQIPFFEGKMESFRKGSANRPWRKQTSQTKRPLQRFTV